MQACGHCHHTELIQNGSSVENDTDMKNINDEYPVSCLPTNLNNRTGKARNCPFEAIEGATVGCYYSGAFVYVLFYLFTRKKRLI
jgi:hypothetical protein